MLFNLHLREGRRVIALMTIGAVLASATTKAWAEPPHLANYWEPTPLTMDGCVQRGITVLRQIGFHDAHLGKSGKVVFGYRDDNHMAVICSIPGWVVFAGASPSRDQIVNYRNELVKQF